MNEANASTPRPAELTASPGSTPSVSLAPGQAASVVLALSITLAAACGDAENIDPGPPDCTGDHVGDWTGDTLDDTLILTADCDVAYTGPTGCQWSGIYRISQGGGMVLDIRQSDGGSCQGTGTLECGLSVSTTGERLQWRCRGTVLEYSRRHSR